MFALIARPFLASIIFAAFFAGVLFPVYRFFAGRLKLGDTLAAFLVLVLTLVFIFAPIVLFLSMVAREVFSFTNSFDQQAVVAFLNENSSFNFFGYEIDLTSLQQNIVSALQQSAGMIYDFALGAGAALGSYILLFVVFLFLFFFFLKDGELILDKFKKLMPFEKKQNLFLLDELARVSKTVFVGNLGVAVLSGVVSYLVFAALGLGGALIWAIMAGGLSLIPTIGSLVVYVIAGAVLGLVGGWFPALILFVYYILAEVILTQNVIKPKIVDDRFGIHPILVFFSLVGGVMIFKSAGILYGPLIIVAFVTILDFIVEEN